jgi:hypothetical protein
MATVTATVDVSKVVPETRTFMWELDGLTTTDTFNSQELSGNADRSVQLVGAAGAGGFNGCTVQVQGSNDGTNFVVLTDGLGNNLSFTAAGIKQVGEMCRYIKAIVTSGTGGTDLRAYLTTRV